jgi:integrase
MKTRSGYLFQRKTGGNWYVRVMVDGKPIVRSTGTPNRRKAEQRKAEIIAPYAIGDEIAVGEALQTRLAGRKAELAKWEADQNPPPTLKQIWQTFEDSQSRPDSSDSTLKQYNAEWRRFKTWIQDVHSDVEHLHEITPAIAADYAKDLTAAKLSASTFNQHRNLLRMIWRVLADECKLTSNPWDKITTKKLTPLANRKRALTNAQFESLLAAVENDPDLKDLFTLLAWTGQRLVDDVMLKWGSVDFSKNLITLAPRKTARRQGKLVYIPIFPAVLEVLNRRQAGDVIKPNAYVLPALAKQYDHDASAVSKAITAAFEKAGIQTSEERVDRGRRVILQGAHSFRHFFVTQAKAAGIPDSVIKMITGHATDSQLDHYEQMGPDIMSSLYARIYGSDTPTNAKANKALPMPQKAVSEPLRALQARVKELTQQLDATNWETIKQQLLEAAG